MENQPIKNKMKKLGSSFLGAILLSVMFVIICSPFLLDATGFTEEKKALIGNVNFWRMLLGFGILSILTAVYFLIRKKEDISLVLFVFLFWFLGIVLYYFASKGDIQFKTELVNDNIVTFINACRADFPLLLLSSWIFGIYYCKNVAKQLEMSNSKAVLMGIFLPILSVIIYFYYSYRKKEKEQKIRILKIVVGLVIFVAVGIIGTFCYTKRTPEYSLYKLKQAIINKDSNEFSKYLDIETVAKNFGESPQQTQAWIDSLNTSVLEFKEENPDKNKDADAYVSTKLSGKNLKYASLNNTGNGEATISLKFDNEGADLFEDLTRRNIGKSIAIFLSGDLASAPIVESEIINGEAVISEQDVNQAQFIAYIINKEKNSQIDGFEIRKKRTEGDSTKITIGKRNNESGFAISMDWTEDGHWRVKKIDTVFVENNTEGKLPNPEGERAATFNWKYKGKTYTLNQKLYDSYYKFYNSLSTQDVFNGESLVDKLEKDNELFIKEFNGDKTISELAQSIQSIGEENKLNENQIVELVSAFVQTIPYDTDKFNKIKAGNKGKVYYPYEVLYNNKGVCSDKSYLAYSLLRDLGYGVSLFLFPDPADRHMAIGIKCPVEYSNYDSGYCFLETTSLGNKIGSQPNLSKEFGTATSKVELADFSNDSTESDYSPLGRIEVLNKTEGLVYTGVIDTFNTQKEIDNLSYTIRKMDNELNASRKDLDNQDEKIGKMVDNLDKLAKSSGNGSMSAYNEYNDLYPDYKKAYSNFEKDRKAFNAKIATRNLLNTKYNNLLRTFYQ